jgi:hypothetical protein
MGVAPQLGCDSHKLQRQFHFGLDMTHTRIRSIAAIAIFAGFSVGVAVAGDDQIQSPKSPTAIAAIKHANEKIDSAKVAFREAESKALHEEIESLDAAETTATKHGDLDEANAISSKVAEVRSELASLSPPVQFDAWDVMLGGDQHHTTYWLFADGHVITSQGYHCTWTKSGRSLTIPWPGGTERWTIDSDGRSLTGTDYKGRQISAFINGSDLSGAVPPKQGG